MIISITLGTILLAAILLQLRPEKPTTKSLEKLFPIYKVERDCIISKHGDLTVVFELELPEIFSMSTEDFHALHHTWTRALRILPPGSILHKQDWYTHDVYQASEDNGERSFLTLSSDRFFQDRPILKHRSFVMITRRAIGRKPSSSAFSNLLRPVLVPQELVKGQFYLDFHTKVSQFKRLLAEGGFIRPRRLTAEEISGTKEKPGLLERYCFLMGEKDTPALKEISFKPQFRIGEKFCQLYALSNVEDLPALCGPRITYDKYSTDQTKFPISFAAPVGQLLGCDHIYNQFVIIEDPQATLKKLEAKRRRLQSLSAYSRENAISRDATNEFLNEAISQARQPVRSHFNLMVWTSDHSQLKELRNLASSAISQLDAVPREEIKGAAQLYWAALPGNASDIPDNECFDTFAEQATCFFSQETAYRDSPSPFGIRLIDRQYGAPVWTDLSDWPYKQQWTNNLNKVIIGSSGSGKSFIMNALCRAYIEQNSHVVIIDIGHSYQGVCKILGGYYFTHTEANPIQFNPFYIEDDDILDTERKESIKTLLVAIWKKDDEHFRRSEYVALSNALQLYYDKLSSDPTIFPCFDTFYEFIRDEFSLILESQQVKEKEFDLHNFLYVLRPFYKEGEFHFLLNAHKNLDLLKQPLVIFELDNIKDHNILFSVATATIMQLFINKMRKLKGVRKVIVIEEAWKAIAKAGMADFIKYLYKTVRKFFGEAIICTQELDDVINSPVVKDAIINNADTKILLDMRKFANKFEQIQAILGLSDKGKAMVLSLNKANDPRRKYREFFVDWGGQHMCVYGFEPSPEEYYAYTTDQREKVVVEQYAARFNGDVTKGIRALIADQREKSGT
ncbi:TraG family conjugative transposon ATPase [Chitinophaga sp. NPDC101104]|uniref:TraG family conjugative transposon ATPase n=1 Tax=Chitinophaga sp. NPDC101104 TaxID=3390561 RepID=UPI003D08E8DB